MSQSGVVPVSQLAGRCAYCGLAAWLYLTGRRYICGGCWREHMGEAPPEQEIR